MATIQKREGVNGPSYRVLVRHRGHTPEYRTFRKKSDALAFAAKADTAINEGAGGTLREAKKRTSAEAIKKYVESVIAARDDKSTARHYSYWSERLGHMRLANITADIVAAARDDLLAKTTRLGKPMAPATVKLYLESLSAVFKACRKEYRWTQYNPVRDVTMPKTPIGRDRYLSDAERVNLLAECQKSPEPRIYPFVVLAISTGARASELTSLVWGDVDLERGVAALRDTKNGDMRALPVKGAALAGITAMQPEGAAPTLHVFAGPPGPIFDYAKPYNVARDAAEIKNFRFHDCRHSTASYLAMNGASARFSGTARCRWSNVMRI